MRRILAVVLGSIFCLSLLVACTEDQVYQDGTYTARFAEYDSRGYRDFIQVTITDGKITGVVYDAQDPEGSLKSRDEVYAADMDAVQNNYPEQVHSTLVNQLLANQDIGRVDVVAGSTYSSDCFKALFNALQENMYNGDASEVMIENIPER